MAKKTAPKKAAAKKRGTPASTKENLEEIMVDMLKDIYWAEHHLAKALPKLSKAAQHPQLKKAFDKHTTETRGQIELLKKCFEALGKKAQGKKCDAMEGLVKEGQSAIADHAKGNARDAALIAESQKAEHYEISTYGSLRTMATVLGYKSCANIFEKIKDQEANTDESLSRLAETINRLAAQD
jgi:ferritin-like metal-binding protein YciE